MGIQARLESQVSYVPRGLSPGLDSEQGHRDSDNQLDHTMLLIFCLVLLFSADHEKLQQRELVENVQLKYTTLLRRYLKSKMAGPAANKKFLEAIMLISDTKELWDINERYIVE